MGLLDHSPTLRLWIGQAGRDAPSLGGFLLITVASILIGMTVSVARWATIDTTHRYTGLRQSKLDFSKLQNREQGFEMMIDIHYRYYQFYSNSIIAIPLFLVGRWTANGFSMLELLGGTAISILFLAGSRDTLRKYNERVNLLFSA